MKVIPIETDEHWHALRAKTIGSSEAAALFDRSPYVTKFALWHAKAGLAELPDPGDDGRVSWGTLLEPAVAIGVAREMAWNLEHRRVYCMHDLVEGMGCTVDRFITDHENGPGIVEIKCVDWLIWKQQWTATRAPFHIELQLQHQLAITGYSWGAIAVLVGGNDLRIYERKPDVELIVELEAKVADFWGSVRGGRKPNAYGDAAETRIMGQVEPVVDPAMRLDLTGDDALAEMVAELTWAADQRKACDKIEQAAKARMIALMGKAAVAYVDGFELRLQKINIAERDQHVKAHVQHRLTVKPLSVMPGDLGVRAPELDQVAENKMPVGDASPFM